MTEEAGRGTSGKEVKAGTEMDDESLFHCAPLAGVINRDYDNNVGGPFFM